MFECCIKRDRSSLSKKLYPAYILYFNEGKFLMMAQRMNIMGSSYYSITVDHEITNRDSPGYLGKLRLGNSSNEYNIFGDGENPKTGLPLDEIRIQHGGIIYNNNIIKNNYYRNVDVIIPRLLTENKFYIWKPMKVI